MLLRKRFERSNEITTFRSKGLRFVSHKGCKLRNIVTMIFSYGVQTCIFQKSSHKLYLRLSNHTKTRCPILGHSNFIRHDISLSILLQNFSKKRKINFLPKFINIEIIVLGFSQESTGTDFNHNFQTTQ